MRANLLGDVRAEVDSKMLNAAFFESADYRTLIESSDRCIVVGRRGAGKSALAYRLGQHYSTEVGTKIVTVSPDEDQIIGLRPIVEMFGSDYRLIRAGSIVAWRYALLMELMSPIYYRVKRKEAFAHSNHFQHMDRWCSNSYGFTARLREVLKSVIDPNSSVADRVSDLAQQLEMREVEGTVRLVLEESKTKFVLIIDRLDEGYEPDDTGVALINGLIQAAIDVNTKFSGVRPIVFVRDNIYRAVAKHDPDFSRNIEGQTLRLHWDEYGLLNLIASRLRVAFDIKLQQSARVWDQCTARELHGNDGFRRCLRLTLYRPRDLLILLNDAFLSAGQQDRDVIVPADMDWSAKTVSTNRLDDLVKEYTSIFPSLQLMIGAFANRSREMTVRAAAELLAPIVLRDDYEPAKQRYFTLAGSPEACLRDLYGVGFLGLEDLGSGQFVFSHDGKDPSREFSGDQRILIHPCYWMALNLADVGEGMAEQQAQDIYDEYEIRVTSNTPVLRSVQIGRLIAELNTIPEGQKGWSAFEDWSFQALRTVLAGHLRNFEMRANKNALQRRDILATNHGETLSWRRILEDYKSRQVIFEIKNYSELTTEDFRQMLSYLTGDYGQCGFFITRAKNDDLTKGRELDWVRELYKDNKVLAVKLSAKTLSSLLSKLRSPQKHDAVDKQLNAILDRYIRLYMARR